MGWDVDDPGVGSGAVGGGGGAVAFVVSLGRDHIAARKHLELADFHAVGEGLDLLGVGGGMGDVAAVGGIGGAAGVLAELSRDRMARRDTRTRGHADDLGVRMHHRGQERDDTDAAEQDDEQKQNRDLAHDFLLSYVCKGFHSIRIHMYCLLSIIYV